MVSFYREREETGFKSMHQIEEVCYIKHNIVENPLSFLNSFTREAKMTHEYLEVPMCRINRH